MGECEKFPPSHQRYEQRFARVLAHIESHPDETVSIEALSAVAAFSRHHFHRQFSGFLGMSAYKYVQFVRMRRASWQLALRPALSVHDIALATGYDAPEAFARAFRQFSGQSPSQFRAAPDWVEWHSRFRPFHEVRKTMVNTLARAPTVRVMHFPSTRVALLEHRGSPLRIGETIRAFIEWRKAHRLSPKVSATFNILHGDPDETAADDFRLGLAAATDQPIAPNDAGVMELVIPAGRCALLRHTGSDDGLRCAIMHLYSDWLPASGEEPRDFPLFLQRVAFFPDVPDSGAITDIYLPLK
jgi:AraC family transcriptional regulator